MTEEQLIALSRSVQEAAKVLEATTDEEQRLTDAAAKAGRMRIQAQSSWRELANQLVTAAAQLERVS